MAHRFNRGRRFEPPVRRHLMPEQAAACRASGPCDPPPALRDALHRRWTATSPDRDRNAWAPRIEGNLLPQQIDPESTDRASRFMLYNDEAERAARRAVGWALYRPRLRSSGLLCGMLAALPSKRLCFLGTEVRFHCGALQERRPEAAAVSPRRGSGASRYGRLFGWNGFHLRQLPRSGAANRSRPVRRALRFR